MIKQAYESNNEGGIEQLLAEKEGMEVVRWMFWGNLWLKGLELWAWVAPFSRTIGITLARSYRQKPA